MSPASIHFLCDANASVGFGHLSRCLKVASALRTPHPIRFEGRFSSEARGRIATLRFAVDRPSVRAAGGVAVVDTMFDKDDMDYYDLARLRAIRRRFRKIVLLSSAMTVPEDLPVDVVIGHMLDRSRRARRSFRALTGLDYAPVSSEFRTARGRRVRERPDMRRVFVGFGASRDIAGLTAVLDALALRNFRGEVDLLLSPFHRRFDARLRRLRMPYSLNIQNDVRTVAPMLRRADIAFGTYGNITFESMCLGTPFLVVAVKDFQLDYARRLAARGLLVCIGKDTALSVDDVAEALARLTPARREALSRRGRRSVDGMGIERIRLVIQAAALEAERT